jgi:hypothetical protein
VELIPEYFSPQRYELETIESNVLDKKRKASRQKTRAREFLSYFIETEEASTIIPVKVRADVEPRPTFVQFEDDPRRLSDSLRMGIHTSNIKKRVRRD